MEEPLPVPKRFAAELLLDPLDDLEPFSRDFSVEDRPDLSEEDASFELFFPGTFSSGKPGSDPGAPGRPGRLKPGNPKSGFDRPIPASPPKGKKGFIDEFDPEEEVVVVAAEELVDVDDLDGVEAVFDADEAAAAADSMNIFIGKPASKLGLKFMGFKDDGGNPKEDVEEDEESFGDEC